MPRFEIHIQEYELSWIIESRHLYPKHPSCLIVSLASFFVDNMTSSNFSNFLPVPSQPPPISHCSDTKIFSHCQHRSAWGVFAIPWKLCRGLTAGNDGLRWMKGCALPPLCHYRAWMPPPHQGLGLCHCMVVLSFCFILFGLFFPHHLKQFA